MENMAWVTCAHCGFTQIPSARCLKCHKTLERTPSAPKDDAPRRPPTPQESADPAVPRQYLLALAGLALLVVAGVLYWAARNPIPSETPAAAAQPTPEPWALDLTGRWQSSVPTTIAGPPTRPALREIFLETDSSGAIVAAGAVLTDPGHGGAGAGYLNVPDGRSRIREISTALAASPHGVALNLAFIPLPPWAPRRDRLWRAVEGQRRGAEEPTYLLLESLEPDFLVQAGVNASGFLSYLFLSQDYVSGRGADALSRVIHPGPGSSLRGFHNLVWDLSGAADFVTLQVRATISQPAGSEDRLILHRQ